MQTPPQPPRTPPLPPLPSRGAHPTPPGVPYAASQFTPHERAQPLGGGPASEGYGGRSPYIQPPSSSGGGLRAALGVGVVALLAAFWILDPLDLQLGANFDGAGDAMADAKEGEQARRDRVFQLRGSKSNDLAAVLELLAPTPDIQPDARFVAALRWLNAASGDASASVELRAAGGNHEVFVADKRVGSWNRVPSALALWSVIDAHASGVAAAIEWSGEAPREANWGEVADTSKALAVAEETAKAWRAGKQTRAIAARHATALVALVLLAPADLGASDDLAANAIGAVALAAAAGAPMEGQRAALEHALGYTVQAAGRELPADLPSGLRTALTSAGQRRTVAAHGDATPLEHAALLRHSTEGDDVADYAALVDDAVRRAPRDLAVSYLQFRATWAPIHIDDHLARIEATCVGAAAHANDRGTKERMYEAPKRLSKLLASLPDGSDRAFDADDVRGAFCRAHAHDTIDDLVHFVVEVQGAPGSEQFPRVFTSPRPEDAGFLESLQLCAEARRAKGLGPELAKRAFARDDLLPRAWQALLPLALRKGRFNDEVTVISDRLVAHLDGRPSRREALAKHIASLGERAAADGVLASILDDSGRSLASASAEALSAAEDVDALLAWALDDGATSPARNAALDQLVSLSPREGLDIGADRLSRAMDLAITATPRASSALDRKADWLHDQARHEEVVALMEAAIARGEFADGLGEAVAYTNLARAQRNLGRYPEALAAASKAAELGTAASFDELARALTHVGELAEAKRVHQARVQRYPTPGADSELARLAWIRGEPDEAVRVLLADPKRPPDMAELARQLDAAFPLVRGADGEPLSRGRDATMIPALDAIIAARSPLIDLAALGTSLARKERYEADIHLTLAKPETGHSKHRLVSKAYVAARRAGYTRADTLALVTPHLPPQPDGIAAVVQLADYAYDLPWLDAPDATQDARAAHMAWLARAAGEAERGFPDADRRRKLDEHYASPPKDLYDALAHYILGRITADEVWPHVATDDQVTEALFYLGSGAWGQGDPYLAMRYWRACVATQRNRNVEWTAAGNRVWSRSFVNPTLPKFMARDRLRDAKP